MKNKKIPGNIICFALLAELIVLLLCLKNVDLLTTPLKAAVCLVVIVVDILIIWLTRDFYKKIRFLLGLLLTFCMAVVMVIGIGYEKQIESTLQAITNDKQETKTDNSAADGGSGEEETESGEEPDDNLTHVGVYAKAYLDDDADTAQAEGTTEADASAEADAGTETDPDAAAEQAEIKTKVNAKAEALDLAESSTFGVLENIDVNTTQKAIAYLEQEAGHALQVTQYQIAGELVDELLAEKVDYILLNPDYFEAIQNMENYEELAQQVVEVESVGVEPDEAKPADASDQDDNAETAQKQSNVYTFYISGIDTRSEKMAASSLSDVNIIATINMDTKEALLLSTPRDYFVPLSISGGRPDKLTHAGVYGIDVCVDTMEMLYDIKVDYYFRVNFSGFVKIIDALGGITVHSDYEFDSKNILGYHFVQGDNEMDGEAALVFARERFSFAEGDRQRGRDQMYVIQGVLKKATASNLVKNLSVILESLKDCFETDMPYDEMTKLILEQLPNFNSYHISTYSVNGTGASEVPYSMNQKAYVMVPDQSTVDYAKDLMTKVRNGEILNIEQ